jgi:hypothetical protein
MLAMDSKAPRGNLTPRVIVQVHREHARSYKGAAIFLRHKKTAYLSVSRF